MCYTNKKRRTNSRGHRWYLKPRPRLVMSAWEDDGMMKPKGTTTVGASHAARGDLLANCPLVHQYVTDALWEDGEERMVSTLMFFTDGALWKALLNDRALALLLWGEGETPETAVASIEERLATGCATWRAATGGKRVKK